MGPYGQHGVRSAAPCGWRERLDGRMESSPGRSKAFAGRRCWPGGSGELEQYGPDGTRGCGGAKDQSDVTNVAANASRLSADARNIVGGIKLGRGAAGKLLADPQTASEVTDTVANAFASPFYHNSYDYDRAV